jgi:hypothetical protein
MRFLIFLIPALAAAVTVRTDFEGGSLCRIEKVSETHFCLGTKGEKDQDGRLVHPSEARVALTASTVSSGWPRS